MNIFQSHTYLARFFQIGSVKKTIPKLSQNHKFSSNFRISFYALSLFLFSSQISQIEAQEWKLLHESEVLRVFEMDQDLTSAKISALDWEIPKATTFKTNSEIADLSTSLKDKKEDRFVNSFQPMVREPFLINASYHVNEIGAKSFAWGLESFLRNSCFEVQFLRNKFNIPNSMFHFVVFLDSLPGISKYSSNYELSFATVRNSKGLTREIDSAASTHILGMSDSFAPRVQTAVFELENQVLLKFNYWIAGEYQERWSDLAKLNTSGNLFVKVSNARKVLPQSHNQAFMFSAEASLGKEKRIVRNQNWKILSLWHPNLNELHSVNCSMQCEDFPLKLMTMKSARDLKFFC